MKSINTAIVSIVYDIFNGNFMKRKWHLHAVIALVFGFVTTYFLNGTFNGVPYAIRFLIVLFICTAFFALWEWFQGAIWGANKTKSEAFESRKDIIFSSLVSIIGIITGLIILN